MAKFSKSRSRKENLEAKQAAIEATTDRLTSQPKPIPQHPAIISSDNGQALEVMIDAKPHTSVCIANSGQETECIDPKILSILPHYAGVTTHLKISIAYRDPLAVTKPFQESELAFTKKLAGTVFAFHNLESLRVFVQIATEPNQNTPINQYVWHHLKHLVWWYKYDFKEIELYIWAIEGDSWNLVEEGSMVDKRMVKYKESLAKAGVL